MILSSKISLKRIFKDHFKSISTAGTGKVDISDIVTFVIIPFLIASVLTYFCLLLDNNSISIIIGALSILVGLLFNVLVLVFDMVRKDKLASNKNTVLHEVLANISFTIIISVFGIISTAFALFDHCWVKITANWITYALLSEFLMTFFMIMKRMYALLEFEMNSNDGESKG